MTTQAHCLSDLRFDALLGDELSGGERSTLLSHLDECATCRDRLSAVAYERSCFLASELAAPRWLKQLQERRAGAPTPWRMFALIALLACALLAGLHAQRPKKQLRARDHVSVYAERANLGEDPAHAEPMHAGDVLRFAYTAARPRELAILGVDANRRVQLYFPKGARSERVEAGAEVFLPAVPVDRATLADEQVYALFCDASFALEPLRATLAATGAVSGLPRGCVTDALTLRKEATSTRTAD